MKIALLSCFMVWPACLAIRERDDSEYWEWCESRREGNFCHMLKNCHFSVPYRKRRGDIFNERCSVDCHDILFKDVVLPNIFQDFDTSYDKSITQEGKKFVKADKCGNLRYYPNGNAVGKLCTRKRGGVCVDLLPSFEVQSFMGMMLTTTSVNSPWLIRDANDNNVVLFRATYIRNLQSEEDWRPYKRDVLRIQIGKDFGIRVLYCPWKYGVSCSSGFILQSAGLGHEDVMLASETEEARYQFWTGHEVIQSKIDAGMKSGGGDQITLYFENYSGQLLNAYSIIYRLK